MMVDSTIAVTWDTGRPSLANRGSSIPLPDVVGRFEPSLLSTQQRHVLQRVLDGSNVVVRAVAGAGKTRTALTTAIAYLQRELPRRQDLAVVMIAYNRRLRQECCELVQRDVPSPYRERIHVHTYYSLSASLFGLPPQVRQPPPPGSGAPNDDSESFDESLRWASTASVPLRALKVDGRSTHIGLLILDEVQDMTDVHHAFIVNLLVQLSMLRAPSAKAPTMMLVGDPCQLVYGYRSASARYMMYANDVFRREDADQVAIINPAPFEVCHLNESYRVSPEVAKWVNDNLNPILLAPQYPAWADTEAARLHVEWWGDGIVGRAERTPAVEELVWKPTMWGEGGDPDDDVNSLSSATARQKAEAVRQVDPAVLSRVNGLCREFGGENVAILSLSVKQPKGDAQKLAAAMDFTTSLTVNGKRLREGAVDVTSITSFKGLERDVIILLGFDSRYEALYNDDPSALLNQFYVGATRARKRLVVVRPLTASRYATVRSHSLFRYDTLSDEQKSAVDVITLERANVVVNAVAGSGKTRTALTAVVEWLRTTPVETCSAASQNTDQRDQAHHSVNTAGVVPRWRYNERAVVCAYNKRLERDMSEQATDRMPAEARNQVRISTIHALANGFFFPTPREIKDETLREIVTQRIPMKFQPNVGLVIIDEAQDLTPELVGFLRYFLAALPRPPQLVVSGDIFQLLYAKRGASAHLLLSPEDTWKDPATQRPLYRVPTPTTSHDVGGPAWYRVRLSVSYRITHEMANFINACVNPCNMSKVPKYNAYWQTHGDRISTMWGDGIHAAPTREPAPGSVEVLEILPQGGREAVAELLQREFATFGEHESAVIGFTVKAQTPLRVLANLLPTQTWAFLDSSGGADSAVVEDQRRNGQRPEEKNKRVAATLHQFKGLERELVVFVGFDAYYEFSNVAQEVESLFNSMYVALTRARKRLIVVRWTDLYYATHPTRWNLEELGPGSPDELRKDINVTDLVRKLRVDRNYHHHDHEDSVITVTDVAEVDPKVFFQPRDVYIPGMENSRGEETRENIAALYGVAVEMRVATLLCEGKVALSDPQLRPYAGCRREFADAHQRVVRELGLRRFATESEWADFLPFAHVIHVNDSSACYAWNQQKSYNFAQAPKQKLTTAFENAVHLLYAALFGENDEQRRELLALPPLAFDEKLRRLAILHRTGRLTLQRTIRHEVHEPQDFRVLVATGIEGAFDYILEPLKLSPDELRTRFHIAEKDMELACVQPRRCIIAELKVTRETTAHHRLQLACYGALQAAHTVTTVWPEMFLLYATAAKLQRLEVNRTPGEFIAGVVKLALPDANESVANKNWKPLREYRHQP
jgi:superfamily I DNA/RNA helicase